MVQTVEPYRGIPHSIDVLVRSAREDRHDQDIRGWAIDVLTAAGCDGRANQCSIRDTAQVLLDALRAKTIYVPDPTGSELIQAPHVTLCLRDRCIPAEDCDGLVRALMAAMLSIGMYPYLVIQDFGPDTQPHVLIGLIDETNQRLYVDCANTTSPVYTGSRAMSEEWIDPMSEAAGFSGAQMVTLSGVPKRNVRREQGLWVERRYDKSWVYRSGTWTERPERAGLGAVLGWHTVHELSDLVSALSYQEEQISKAYGCASPEWVNRAPQEFAAFSEAFQAAEDAWKPILEAARSQVERARDSWDWTPTVTLTFGDGFDAVAKAFEPFIELDRAMRASKTFPANCLPSYPNNPQSTAPDFDLSAFQIADSTWQKAKQLGASTQSALEKAAPYLAIFGLGLGAYAVYRITR